LPTTADNDVAGKADPPNGRWESAVDMELSETVTLQAHHNW